MKTFKKALSVMLCLCMLMSAMAVGLNVFAQEKSEAVARFEANVEAFDGDVTKASLRQRILRLTRSSLPSTRLSATPIRKASMSLFLMCSTTM